MKREIVCNKCQGEHCKALAAAARQHSEFFHTMVGIARREYVCDFCGRSIPAGARCVAWSCALTENEYQSWEGEFLEQIP